MQRATDHYKLHEDSTVKTACKLTLNTLEIRNKALFTHLADSIQWRTIHPYSSACQLVSQWIMIIKTEHVKAIFHTSLTHWTKCCLQLANFLLQHFGQLLHKTFELLHCQSRCSWWLQKCIYHQKYTPTWLRLLFTSYITCFLSHTINVTCTGIWYSHQRRP